MCYLFIIIFLFVIMVIGLLGFVILWVEGDGWCVMYVMVSGGVLLLFIDLLLIYLFGLDGVVVGIVLFCIILVI